MEEPFGPVREVPELGLREADPESPARCAAEALLAAGLRHSLARPAPATLDRRIASWRAFHGLNALGKTAALYMYPYEAHGPRAQETILDLWTRWVAWLDLHVLGEGAEAGDVVTDGEGGSGS